MERAELHLRDYIRVVRKRKYTVATVFLLVVAVVVLATFSSTPLYRGDVRILIEKSEPSSLNSGYRWYPAYDPEFYETQYQLIKSRAVAKRVVEALALHKSDLMPQEPQSVPLVVIDAILGWFGEVASAAGKTLGVSAPGAAGEIGTARKGNDAADRVEALAQRIQAEIDVRPVRDSRIVEVSYLSPNPQLAASLANAVASAYIEEMLEIRLSGARRTVQWVAKKTEEERRKLEKSEKALQQYMRANDIVTLEDRVTVTPQKLSDVSTHLMKAEAKRKELEVLYGKTRELSAEEGRLDTLPTVAGDPAVGALRSGIVKAEQRIAELGRKYGPKHPAMIQAVEDLDLLKAKRKQEVDRIVASIRNEFEMAQANERELRALLEETKNQASGLNEKFIQYGILKREVEANRQMYDALAKKLKEESVTQDNESVEVWIVDDARPSKFPVKPRKRTNVLLGLLGGLVAGLGMAFFLEYLDNSVKTAEDTEAALGVPVLGVISNVRSRRRKIEEAMLDNALPTVAEEYKTLRTAVLLSSAGGPPKTLVVTSMTPEEGKTTTALNLAISIAQSKRRVVLVDADLRRPKIHSLLGLENSVGLSTYLTDSSVSEVLMDGPHSHLKVITAGLVPPNPSELLSSQRMADLVDSLAELADVVIIDSPPVLSVTDSRILAKLAAGTIVVARARKTTFDTMRAGLKALRDIDARVLGIVVNRFEAKRSGYGYYRYANYYYQSDKREA